MFVPSVEPHEAHTLLTPEAFFYCDNNSHVWLILELTGDIRPILRTRYSRILLEMEKNDTADRLNDLIT